MMDFLTRLCLVGDNFGPRQELPEGANTNHYYWFTDVASMGDELITPVCSGSLVWHIPIDWRSCNNPAILHSDFKVVDQRFEMSDTGRLTVSKHGHWAAREMSGVTYKSEGME